MVEFFEFSQPERERLYGLLNAYYSGFRCMATMRHTTDAEREIYERDSELIARLASMFALKHNPSDTKELRTEPITPEARAAVERLLDVPPRPLPDPAVVEAELDERYPPAVGSPMWTSRNSQYQVGDRLLVALEGPGPGLRTPHFLRKVEGVVKRLDPYTMPEHQHLPPLLVMEFTIDEDNWNDWEALMPDQMGEHSAHLVKLGDTFELPDIDPEWVVRKIS